MGQKTMAAWNFAEENLTTAITFRCHKTTSETTKTSISATPSADTAPQTISKIRPKENFQIGPMPPPSLPGVSGHLAPNRQSEGRAGRTQEGCKSTRRANDSRTGNSASNTNIAGPDGRSPARFSSALCLAPPPPAALLSQHHSHFLASPVGYLYERGDR